MSRRTSLRSMPAGLARLGLALLVAAGMTAVTVIGASPAYAQGPADLTAAASGNPTLAVGGQDKRVVFTITNKGPADAEDIQVQIDVPLGDQGVSIIQGPDGCDVNGNTLRCTIEELDRNDSEQLFVRIAPPREGGPGPGESRQGQGQVRVDYREDLKPNNNSAGYTVTLNGPEKKEQVPSVTGTVKDNETNKAVDNAKIVLTDGEGTDHKTASNSSGHFELKSTENKPIAPGTLKIAVTKDGYQKKSITKTGDAGQSVTANLMLIAKPKPTATPSSTATEAGGAAAPTNAGGEDEESGSWLPWLFYLLAAALLLGGIGAIVWLFMRRNEDDAEDEYDEAPGRPGAAPIGARGAYRDPYGAPTSVMGGGQPTTVLGGEAPTSMLHRPGVDQPTSMMNRPGTDQPTSRIGHPGVDQPTSMIDRSGVDQPTMSHPGPLAPDDDVYPEGRERYASGHSYGPGSGYGEPGYGREPGYGDQGYYEPGYGRDQGRDPGYGPEPGPAGGRHSGGDGYDDRGYGQPPRRGGRHSSGDDRRLDWYED